MGAFHCAAALVTATGIETEGVRRLYRDWTPVNIPDDEQDYYETRFCRDDKAYRLVTAQQNEMGMTAAASLAQKLIWHFRPRYLIMTGIAAGLGRQQIYGDVIVPNVVWNYSAGKFVRPDRADIQYGEVGFLPRPVSIYLRPETEEAVRAAAASERNQCCVHIGPMACGNAVISNREFVDKQVRSQFPLTAGLDMESYGIFYAAKNAAGAKPDPIVIKSVCDYADEEKSDIYQKFAAYTSSEFAKLLYEVFLPLDSRLFGEK